MATNITTFNPFTPESGGYITLPGDPTVAANTSTINSNGPEDTRFVHQINDQFYHIEVWIYNDIEGYKPFFIPFTFIHSILVDEQLSNWNTKGYIILKNDYELFERGSISVKTNSATIPQIPAPYVFRTDGKNKMSIRIYPISSNPFKDGIKYVGDVLPNDLWEISLDLVIYDIEDLPTKDNPQEKLKKLYFHDERYQILKERNIEWSTSVYGNNNNQLGSTDQQRSMSANEAMKSILAAAASSSSDPNKPSTNVGYDPNGGSIQSPTIPFANFGIWDAGPNNQLNNVIYTSPANVTVLDDLNYMYTRAIGSDGGPVIIDYGRWSGDKKWYLNSLNGYFTNASNYQIERLTLEDGIDPTTSPPYVPRGPDGIGTDAFNFVSGKASRIQKYKFSPMVEIDDSRIVNRPVHNYDFSTGQFNIYCEANTAAQVAVNLQNIASNGLYAYNQPNSKQVLLNINKIKSTGLALKNYFSPATFCLPNHTALNMIKDAIFLNESLYFQAPGLTFRTPGKYIFVDRYTSSLNNPFDDRFLGQWFIIKTAHLFTQDKYVNDVVAVKVDAFSKLWDVIDK